VTATTLLVDLTVVMESERFVIPEWADTAEYRTICSKVDALIEVLKRPDILSRIDEANQPRRSSAAVQAAFVEEAIELGFRSESKGLFATSKSSGLRPDYFLQLGDTGILLEVERGKTTINNMDLLDFWKCHICEVAHYLVLMVPLELRQNAGTTVRREFESVRKRLSSFFDPGNATNVRGLFIIGY